MPDTKISALLDGTAPQAADLFPVARSAGNRRLSWAQLRAAAGGAANRLPACWFPRLVLENAQTLAPPGVANWTRGDMRMTVSTTAGSNVVTRTAGAPMSDAGTGAWMGVLRNGDAHSIVNVLSSSGNDITLAQVIQTTGSMELGAYHDAVLGQHLSPLGGAALADLIFDCEPFQMAAPPILFDVDSLRGTWYSTPWNSPFSSPQYWAQYGGLANNQASWAAVQNTFTVGTQVVVSTGTRVVSFNATGTGQGGEIVIQCSGPGLLAITFGHGLGSSSLTNQIRLTVLTDGVQIHQSDYVGGLRRAVVPFGNCSELRARITSLQAAQTVIFVSRTQVFDNPAVMSAAVNPGDRVLPIGDSWLEEATRPELVARLRTRASRIGAEVLASVGVSGTQASYALAVVSGRRRIDTWLDDNQPTAALIHYYINDHNAGVSAATWAANISEIVRTCLARGVRPLVMGPGCTASSSQTQPMNANYGSRVGVSSPVRVSITEALQTEIAAVDSFVNVVQKTAGRALRNTTNNAVYVARGRSAADPWDCVTPSATPATITPS